MAYRAAVHSTREVAAVIAVGADVPPEIAPHAMRRLPAALIARGTSDEWYTKEQFAKDEQLLRNSSVSVCALEFNGGHEWSAEVAGAASKFLRGRHF